MVITVYEQLFMSNKIIPVSVLLTLLNVNYTCIYMYMHIYC